MTTESAAPEMLHGWAIYLRAGEEARRRGDRRSGTDHLLLALLEDPSLEALLGVSLQQARQALESLDREALGALGLGQAMVRGQDAASQDVRDRAVQPQCHPLPGQRQPGAEHVISEAGASRSPNPVTCPLRARLASLRAACDALAAALQFLASPLAEMVGDLLLTGVTAGRQQVRLPVQRSVSALCQSLAANRPERLDGQEV